MSLAGSLPGEVLRDPANPTPSPQAILELALGAGRGMIKGKVAAVRRFNSLTSRQRAFLDEVDDASSVTHDNYQHPARHTKVFNAARPAGPLTPVEVAWLGQLPRDPKEIRFDDAAELASLDRQVSRIEHPADSRLIRAVWEPVRLLHDRRAAEAALSRASQPPNPVPAGTVSALADAVAHDHPTLNSVELFGRADVMLRDTLNQREDTRQAAIADARAEIDRVDNATKDREAVTR